MSIVQIARECGWRSSGSLLTCQDVCVVCLERKCTVAAEGCNHEFCTQCALYVCSTNCMSTIVKGPPGSIACPLCRHGIVSFVKLLGTVPVNKEPMRTSLPLPFCTCSADLMEPNSLTTPLCKPSFQCTRISPLGSSFRSLSCSSIKLNSSLCMGAPDTSPSLNLHNQLGRSLRSSDRRSTSSQNRRSCLSALNQYVTTGSGC